MIDRAGHARMPHRRQLLLGAAGLAFGATVVPRIGGASTLALTPRQTAGPFYPGHLDLAALDADLLRRGDGAETTEGTRLSLTGRVLDRAGQPVPGAAVLIWQADSFGHYNHPADDQETPRDPLFEGVGLARTDGAGAYRFRTLKPAAYPLGGSARRTPHIHVAVGAGDTASLVTQMYFPDEPLNARDGLVSPAWAMPRRA